MYQNEKKNLIKCTFYILQGFLSWFYSFYSSEIAVAGHSEAQVPQLMQEPESI